MKDIDNLSHTSYRCKYHVVIIPKYRRMIIVLSLISYMLCLIMQPIILMVTSKLFGLLVHVDVVLEIISFLITIIIELIVIIIFNIKISKISIINLLKNSDK